MKIQRNMNKHYQKQNIKKEYAAARNAGSQTAGTATKNTGKKLGEKASDKIKEPQLSTTFTISEVVTRI